MKKIFKFRQNVTILLTNENKINCTGPWHYTYVEEEIANTRMQESITTFNSIQQIANAEIYWPDVSVRETLFTKRPYLFVMDCWGGYRVYPRDFSQATWMSEYVSCNHLSMNQLMEELPAADLIEYFNDNGLNLK